MFHNRKEYSTEYCALAPKELVAVDVNLRTC